MYVLLKNATVIKPFDLSNDIDAQPTLVTLAEVHKMSEYSKVTVVVKVLSKDEPVQLKNDKTKQEVGCGCRFFWCSDCMSHFGK